MFYRFLSLSLRLILSLFIFSACSEAVEKKAPNILILHADQWRAQAFGYAGDPNVRTPNFDAWAKESANLRRAVSGMPVCTPHRASLLTGQRALTNGIFMNDVQLDPNAITLAEVLAEAGYQTGYIGKWHLDGSGRSDFTPPGPRRQGFQYWKALECSHNYNQSAYYHNDNPQKQFWEGYDTFSQTEDAQAYLQKHAKDKAPFFLMLSWGTPHAPYHTAPEAYRDRYKAEEVVLRPNVPKDMQKRAKRDLAGYYSHATALDDMLAEIRKTLRETGLEENTIVLFSSDHGDLIGSHGAYKKQQAYEESIRVPMLISGPGIVANNYDALFNTEDIMPTLLGLVEKSVPEFVEGIDYSNYLQGTTTQVDTATVIACIQPFGQWNRIKHGGREYRGLRTLRYTYARALSGPWLLFDNEEDPYQLRNLVGIEAYMGIQEKLDDLLSEKLASHKDEFLPGLTYVKQYNYPELNDTETVPYRN